MSQPLNKIFTYRALPILICLYLGSCMPKSQYFEHLQGTWLMKKEGIQIGETWKKESEQLFYGSSFIIKGNDTTIYETVELAKKENDWQYTVKAAGQNNEAPVSFKLTQSDNNTYSFENPAHDFPKRIIYRFIGADSIHASIDDGSSGKEEHFYFSRQK